MNPRTRRIALYAIAAVAVLASLNALAHSFAGLYQWALHHRMSGWQAATWPAEVDVFLIVGELALYVAYLDQWPARHKTWPWAVALFGLAVSVAGNVGHIPGGPQNPTALADRITAATSPVAAFAGLAIALLVLKQTGRPRRTARCETPRGHSVTARMRRGRASGPMGWNPAMGLWPRPRAHTPSRAVACTPAATLGGPDRLRPLPAEDSEQGLLHEAEQIMSELTARGERPSQRKLARHLRARGHTISNDRLPALTRRINYHAAPETPQLNAFK